MAKELNYYKRLFSIWNNYRRKKVKTSALPFRIWVEMHSGCNLKCVMCPNKDLDESLKGPMEWDVFKSVIDQSKEFIFDMTLNHRGESLMHERSPEFIEYAARNIKRTKLHTNGVHLNEDVIKSAVDNGLFRLSFSFDGFVKEDYEKVRVGADFDLVVQNIKNLLEYKKKKNKQFPVTAIEIIELNDSQVDPSKRDKFVTEFKKLGLNELVIKKPHNWGGYLKTDYKKKKYAPCTFPWNGILVLWDGKVSPCAQDFFIENIVGNVKEKSLKEIWNDEPLQKLRQDLIDKKYQDYKACRDCDRLWRDTFMGVPREYLKQILLHKMP